MIRHFHFHFTIIILIFCAALSLTTVKPLFAQTHSAHATATAISNQRVPQSETQTFSAADEPSEPQALSPEDKALLEEQQLFMREHPVSLVDDWSDHTRAYSNPGTEAQAIANGTHAKWLEIVNDPRYIMSQLRRGLPAQGPGPAALYRFEQKLREANDDPGFEETARAPQVAVFPPPLSPLARDWNVSLGNGGVAAGQFPAKFDANYGNPSCTQDYMLFPVNAAGSATQAMIVGVTNVYPFCNSGVPTVAFAYRYTTNGIVQTSPTISLDGTKVMFIESRATGSRLHILKVGTNTGGVLTLFTTGTVTAPTTPTNGTLTCTAAPGCDYAVTLHGNPQVTRSAFFYDYNSDDGFVGDDLGYLHEFTTVLNGTATEKIGGGGTDAWPMLGSTSLYASGVLSSPSYDPVSKNVFVGDSLGVAYYVRTVAASSGTCFNDFAGGGTAPCVGGWYSTGAAEYYAGLAIGDAATAAGCGGNAFGTVRDAPLVDIVKENVFFATGDSCAGTAPYCPTYSISGGTSSAAGAPMIYELNTAFTDGGGGFGPGALACFGAPNVNNLHLGTFDNLYFNSVATGHLYWESADAITFTPSIWYTDFNAAGVMTSVTEVPHLNFLANSQMDASPLTETVDPYTGTNWLTASVPNNSCGGATSSCGGATNCGCVMTWNITSVLGATTYGPWTPNTTYPLGSEVIDTQGNLQKITVTANAGVSSTITPPWPAAPVAGQTTMDGAPAKASGTGTVVTNNIMRNGGETSAAGTVTFDSGFGPNNGDTVTIGASTYTWTFNEPPTVVNQIYYSFTDPNAAKNLVAAVMGNAALCGDANCIDAAQTANASVTATAAAKVTTLTAITPGVAGNSIVLNDTFVDGATYVLSPATGHLSGGSATGGVGSIAINGTTIDASDPSAASNTGTFTANPASGNVTITNNLGTETLTPSPGTAATAAGTFTASPATGGVRITNGANSMTLIANASVAASATGTFSGVPTNGQTATVGGADAVTASAGKIASATGTFTGDPNLGSTITITNGTGSETLTPSAGTAATAMGTFTANPTGGSVKITNGANSMTLAPSLNTQAMATGTFSGVPANGQTATVGGTDVATASAGAFASATGTFTGDPNLGSTITITNGAGSESLTPSPGTAATAMGTFTANPTGGGVRITNGANSMTLVASPTLNTGVNFLVDGVLADDATNLAAAITRNTSVNVPVTGSSSGAVVTVVDTTSGAGGNSIALSLPATTTATGSFTFSSNATSYCSTAAGTASAIVIGGIQYNLMSEVNSGTPTYCYSCFYDYPANSCVTNTQPVLNSNVLIGGTAAQTAQNLAAAINQSGNASCATTGIGEYGYGAGTCYYGMGLNTRVSAVASGTTVTLTAKVAGAAGNCNAGGAYSTVCDTVATYGWAAQTVADLAEITQSWGGLQGGSSTAITGYSWTTSAGTPPCNGTNNPCNMGGGTSGVTSATTYAIDGVAADDATQLAAAINTAPNPANVGVVATSAGAVVTVKASACGTVGNGITLAKTAANFAWSGANLVGGNTALNTGVDFAVTDTTAACAPLTTTQIASNFAADLTRNVGAVPINPVTSAANVATVTATTAGAAGNGITLASTLSNFAWSPAASLGGGATGVNTGVNFLVDGVLADDATNLAAAITRNTSANVPVTGSSSGAVVTVVDTTSGVAGNNIALSLPATSSATGSFNFSNNATSYCSTAAGTASAIVIGGIQYNLMSEVNSGTPTYCYSCFYDYAANSCVTNTQPVLNSNVLIGGTAAQTAQNLAAAINQSGNASCATTGIGEYGYGAGTCYYGMGLNTRVSAVASGSTVTLTAKVAGVAGNCNAGGAYSTVCDTVATYGWAAQTVADLAEITQSWGGLQGGSSTPITGYSWTASTGTPPCNGTNNPCNMGGGASGVTSATTYAIDGVAADDATQLAAAINTAPNPANAGVTATSAGAVVTVNASACGSAGNGITLAKTAANFAWSGANLAGGNTALNTGVDFAVTDTTAACAPLTTTQIASNFAAALSRNIGAVGIGNPVTSAANVATVAASAAGTAGNSITLASTLSNFAWNPAATLGGGSNGVNTGVYFLTDGVLADNATNLAAAITRNTSANVPVTASSSAAVVTVTDTIQGAAGNNIALSLPAGTPATGSFSFTAQPASELSNADYPGLDAGNVVWWFEAAVGSTCTGSCTNTDYSTRNGEGYSTILIGNTIANTVLNVVAALNNNPALCGYTDPTTTDTGYNTCFHNGTATDLAGALPPQAFMTAGGSASTVTLSATVLGTGGNCAGTCWTSYGWSSNDTRLGTGGDNENISAATGGLSGATNTTVSGYTWTASTGTPPCNGVNNPCNMGGGGNGVTSATTFATDGVLADDATQLAAAMNTAPNPASVGVTATSAGAVVTATAANPGVCLTSSSLTSSAPGFAWASPTLLGASNGIQSATSFVYWNGCAELNAGAIAGNMVASINANSSLNTNLTATNTSGGACAANCNFTLNATANGVIYNYPLATSYTNTTFFWSCPPGTPASAMCGGATGVVWTYQGAGNGQTTLGQPTGTSGIVADSLDYPAWVAAHPYLLNQRITDSNGNQQLVHIAGTSGGTTPAWSTVLGGMTTDGAVTWENVGPSAIANIYYGTLTGTGGNKGVKLTQKGLQ